MTAKFWWSIFWMYTLDFFAFSAAKSGAYITAALMLMVLMFNARTCWHESAKRRSVDAGNH